MRLLLIFPIIAFVAAGCTSPDPPAAGAAGAEPRTVACYEADRRAVIRTLAPLCRGEVVSDRQAAKLEAARIRRVQATAPRLGVREVTSNRSLASAGTGLLIGAEGEVLTSRHVVQNCPVLTVTSADGVNAPAALRAQDAEADLAVLSSDLAPSVVAVFNDDPGSASPFRLAVIGYPIQGEPTATSSLSAAAASPAALASTHRQFLVSGIVRPGHSGSPLVDQSGNVVGVMRAMINTVKVYEKTGQVVDDVALAISNAAILDFLAEQGVAVRSGPSAVTLSDDEILARSSAFVVRVHCWR